MGDIKWVLRSVVAGSGWCGSHIVGITSQEWEEMTGRSCSLAGKGRRAGIMSGPHNNSHRYTEVFSCIMGLWHIVSRFILGKLPTVSRFGYCILHHL